MVSDGANAIALARDTQLHTRFRIALVHGHRNRIHCHYHHPKNPFPIAQSRLLGPTPLTAMEPGASSSFILTSGATGRLNALISLRSLSSVMAYIYALLLLLLGRKEGGGSVRKVRVRPAALSATDQEAAARRALAIRRVVQDGDDNSVRGFSLFPAPRGETLFTQSWTPVSVSIRGLVIILHGLNEHSGRYSYFAKQLNANGFKVFAMDWVGHGGSDGLHAYVPSLDDAVEDLKSFFDKVLAENPGLPCFFFGHSTGAAIVLKALLDPKVEACVAGMAVTSPAIGVHPSHPILVLLAPVLSFLLPRYQFGGANKKGRAVCRDPEALVAKYSDPLVYTGSIRIRTGHELLRMTDYLQKNLSNLRVPFLVLHGTGDTVTDPKASIKLYEEASSSDKSLRLLEGLLHDLLFEPEGEDIVKEIIGWLNDRALLQGK